MTSVKALASGLFVSVLLLGGCAKKPDPVGKWKVAPEVESMTIQGLPAGFMKGFATTFKYELKADKTFVAPMSEGTYTAEGKSVSIKTTKLMGQDVAALLKGKIAPEMKGELSDDGESLTLHPPQTDTQKLPTELQSIKMVREK
jgi:hypothetical protein